MLATTLSTVLADLVAAETPLAAPASPPGTPPQSLRLSRDPQDMAYLYRPGYPATDAGGQIQGSGLPLDLAARWNALSSSRDIPSLDVGSLPLTPFLADYLSAHTSASILAQGQLLLRPSATALRVWLWAFADTCPPPPEPRRAVSLSFPHKQAPLAEALQLSPLALLQYTHMRCHRLAQTCPPPPSDLATAPSPDPRCIALSSSTPTQQKLWRALVTLVDDLAADPLPPTSDPDYPALPLLQQGFLKGYALCVAVDVWLRELSGQPPCPHASLMLQGITHSLAHLLQGWFQVPAPPRL